MKRSLSEEVVLDAPESTMSPSTMSVERLQCSPNSWYPIKVYYDYNKSCGILLKIYLKLSNIMVFLFNVSNISNSLTFSNIPNSVLSILLSFLHVSNLVSNLYFSYPIRILNMYL